MQVSAYSGLARVSRQLPHFGEDKKGKMRDLDRRQTLGALAAWLELGPEIEQMARQAGRGNDVSGYFMDTLIPEALDVAKQKNSKPADESEKDK